MATVLDPLGSPSIFYNRSGLTIQSVAAAGTTGSGATQLILPTGHTTLMVTPSASNTGVKLPADADTEVGDLIELNNVSQSFDVTLYDAGNNVVQPVGNGHSKIIRKIAANTWWPLADLS